MRHMLTVIVRAMLVICGLTLAYCTWPKSSARATDSAINYPASITKANTLLLDRPAGFAIAHVIPAFVPVLVRYRKANWCNIMLPNGQTGFVKQQQLCNRRTAIVQTDILANDHLLLRPNLIVQILNKKDDKILVKVDHYTIWVDKSKLFCF